MRSVLEQVVGEIEAPAGYRTVLRLDVLDLFDQDSLELAHVLPAANGEGQVLDGFPAMPRAFRVGVERSW